MNPKSPILAILPLHSLVIHEYHDDTRTQPLIDKIQASGIFTNPVIVSPLHDHTARYMVLDGANRTTACRKMGFQVILAQVVEPDDLGFETQTWNHVVWDLTPEDFLAPIQAIPGLTFKPATAEQAYDTVINHQGLAAVHLPDGSVWEVHAPAGNIIARNHYLNAIADTYKGRGRMDRTAHRTVEGLLKLYPALSGLVFMPKLRIRHISYLVSQGHRLPAGVTRFTISPRALRVNYPLERLTSGKSLEEKNDELHEFIKQRVAGKGVRYYAEETVMYDE
jgi:hypothetical protein